MPRPDASAIEALGHAPRLVHGEPDNFKLTWPEDFVRAERQQPSGRLVVVGPGAVVLAAVAVARLPLPK